MTPPRLQAVADKTLVGTVVVYPSLNPTGLIAEQRTPSFSSDANRLWPSCSSSPSEAEEGGEDAPDVDEGHADALAQFTKAPEGATSHGRWSHTDAA
jgi:predicted deacylase